MKRKWIIGLILLVVGFSFSSFAESGSALYNRGRARYLSARQIESPKLQRKTYLQAAGELKQFLDLHPHHAKAVAAHFNVGSIYQALSDRTGDREDAGRALHYYREVVRLDPQNRLADDALFAVAAVCKKSFSDLRCHDEALNRIRREYRSGDMIRKIDPKLAVIKTKKPSPKRRAELSHAEMIHDSKGYLLKLELDRPVSLSPMFLPADIDHKLPKRYYVDLGDARLLASIKPPVVPESAPVSRVRFGQNRKEVVRVVLDLSKKVSVGDLSVRQDGKHVSIRIRSQKPGKVKPLPTRLPVRVEAPLVKKRYRIVIDPGHGGDDTGARGPRGTLEKDIVLAIGKKLEKRFSRSSHYEVYMTRRKDQTLALGDRTTFANRIDGDLFLSIHANASPKRSAHGVSTYFLDNADDTESLRVAMLENGELAPPQTSDQGKSEDYYLEIMKASMIKNFHTSQSTDLARQVQNAMISTLKRARYNPQDLGVRSAGFYVLTGAEMPAILVETSFLSNPKEERRLRNPKYQDRLVEAIEKGVEKYLKLRKQDHAKLYQN